MKYIIVSATVNEEICEQFLDEELEYHECKQAKYMGKLLQYPDRSMSRSSIANDPDVVCRLMHYFGMEEDRVITFMNQNIGKLHFGNTEGSNMLEGKDILVVGTPYHAPFLYKLVAYSMGLEFDEEAEMSMQLVTHNGYRFWFNTFADEDLRLVQFWMIESELEQAIGRARLLRHDCTVHLFCRLPLKQAEMVFNCDCGLGEAQKEPALETEPKKETLPQAATPEELFVPAPMETKSTKAPQLPVGKSQERAPSTAPSPGKGFSKEEGDRAQQIRLLCKEMAQKKVKKRIRPVRFPKPPYQALS